jgi:hypothetical protein
MLISLLFHQKRLTKNIYQILCHGINTYNALNRVAQKGIPAGVHFFHSSGQITLLAQWVLAPAKTLRVSTTATDVSSKEGAFLFSFF